MVELIKSKTSRRIGPDRAHNAIAVFFGNEDAYLIDGRGIKTPEERTAAVNEFINYLWPGATIVFDSHQRIFFCDYPKGEKQ